jgi:hypothetical protein
MKIDLTKVDTAAREYLAAKEQQDVVADKVTKCSSSIKDWAREEGVKLGKEVLLTGEVYEIGFLKCDDTKAIDPVRAKKLLTASQYQACLKEVIDEAAVEQLVAQRKIPAEIFLRLLQVTRKGSDRIVVRRRSV